MGSGGCDAVSQYWNMLACSLGWKVKSCFVISGSLKNFIVDHLSKLQCVPAKFQRFWQFRQKFDNNWKLKGSLIAPVLITSKSVTGSQCVYLDKRHCQSAKSTLPISITELCRKLCHREPVTHLEVIKTGAIRLPFKFQLLSNFCLNCQKRWNLAGTRCNFDKWSTIKFFRLPKIAKQLLTFQPRLQASIFQYWLTASQPPIPMSAIHPLL